jgi:hypothetical protein
MKTTREIAIETANELGLTFARPVNQVKTVVIEEAIAEYIKSKEAEVVVESEIEAVIADMTENKVDETWLEEIANTKAPVMESESLEEMPLEAFLNIGNTKPKVLTSLEVATEGKQAQNRIFKAMITERTYAMVAEGKTRQQIAEILAAEYPDKKINYTYIQQILRNSGIEVVRVNNRSAEAKAAKNSNLIDISTMTIEEITAMVEARTKTTVEA